MEKARYGRPNSGISSLVELSFTAGRVRREHGTAQLHTAQDLPQAATLLLSVPVRLEALGTLLNGNIQHLSLSHTYFLNPLGTCDL